MVRSLAREWARYGIRVNSISPGYMDTVLNEGDGLEEARETWLGTRWDGWGGRTSYVVLWSCLLVGLAATLMGLIVSYSHFRYISFRFCHVQFEDGRSDLVLGHYEQQR